MGMIASELRLVAGEWLAGLGAPLQGVYQPKRDRLVLVVAGCPPILLVPRGPHARAHTVTGRPHNPRQPFSFQGACRAHLSGRLEAVVPVEGDRAVDLHFTRGRLHLRLTGRGGGLWLLDGERVIVAYDGPCSEALPPLPSRPPDLRPPRWAPLDGESWNEVANRTLGGAEAAAEVSALRTALRRALRRRVEQLERLLAGLHADLESAATAPGLRRMADTLAAHLHEVRRGGPLVTLPDLEDPSILHHIPLDPSSPPATSLQRLYGRAGRLERAGDRVIDSLASTEAALAHAQAQLDTLDDLDPDTLGRLTETLPAPRRDADAGPPPPWDVWNGPGALQVLIGRNEKANRTLTFQRARGSDWWMHLRDRPGAHLLLPVPRGKTPSLAHLLAAAELCLRAARVAEGQVVEVQYTQAKNLRSIPGSADARVLVHDERVLAVRRDTSALAGWTREDRG